MKIFVLFHTVPKINGRLEFFKIQRSWSIVPGTNISMLNSYRQNAFAYCRLNIEFFETRLSANNSFVSISLVCYRPYLIYCNYMYL